MILQIIYSTPLRTAEIIHLESSQSGKKTSDLI